MWRWNRPGVYWKPIYNLLEGQCQVVVVNAQHLKGVPGRKTDVADAEWIADLLEHGLVRGSFIPSVEIRELRDLTRYRVTLVEERSRQVNRLQKVLEDANLKLSSVATDILGVSGRAILEGLLAGESEPGVLAELAKGRLRAKRAQLEQALQGRVRGHHVFLIAEMLGHVDYLDEAISRISQEIGERLRPFEEEMALLDTIPGIDRRLAEDLWAETGGEMSRFPTARNLASWSAMCPGQHESGGKRKSGKTRAGNPWLKKALIQAAHAATRGKRNYLAAQYYRLAHRRGKQKALVAVGHSILVILYHVLSRQEPYRDLGANYFDERDREAKARQLTRRLELLGYEVTLQPKPVAA